MNYAFPRITGDLINMALKLEQNGLPLPDGWGNNQDEAVLQTYVTYNAPLTAGQEAALNTLMAESTTGSIPVSANSIYEIADLMDLRSTFKVAIAPSGLTCQIYRSQEFPWKIKLIFNKTLSNPEKTAIRNAYLDLLVQIQ